VPNQEIVHLAGSSLRKIANDHTDCSQTAALGINPGKPA
jgi:hypothetical protein